MRLADLAPGQYCTRAEWTTKAPGNTPLIVHRPDESPRLIYAHNSSEVSAAARGRQYNDFYLCDSIANIQTTDRADAFITTGYILSTSSGAVERCANMQSVETRIQTHLNAIPNMKFRIYQLFAVVEPRIQELADMLRIVDPSEPL